nr:complement decay-accelerating factor isoform X3 [Oryctolagus cuniculus]
MSPARPSVPAVLRVLGGRPLLLLLLLLSAPAVRGSCNDPPRLLFASLEKTYSNQNYFPVGSTVDYQCRLGYRRERDLSTTLTCLDNLEWSKPAEFCKKRACPNPGELQNGNVKIETDLLFGSFISLSCNTGYKLIGASSIYCVVQENGVGWSDRLPLCQEISCPEPPKIENGMIKEESSIYVYRQTVTYECNRGFTLVGQHSIYCDAENEEGVWSGPAPECRGRHVPPKPPPEVQESTTVPSAQKPTKVIVPATQGVPVPRATTRVYTTGTTKGKGSSPAGAAYLISGLVAGTVIVGILILVKIFWDYGKSGTHMGNIDSFACAANNRWLAALAKEEKEESEHKCTDCFRFLRTFWRSDCNKCSSVLQSAVSSLRSLRSVSRAKGKGLGPGNTPKAFENLNSLRTCRLCSCPEWKHEDKVVCDLFTRCVMLF